MSDPSYRLINAALAAIPVPLHGQVSAYWQELAPHVAALPAKKWFESLPRVFAASEFVARRCIQQPNLLTDLIASGDLLRPYPTGELAIRVARLLEGAKDELSLKTGLRRLRQRELVRIAWRDLAGWADLKETLATLSEFADACVHEALEKLHVWACANSGEPRGEHSGKPQKLVVLALGKLGGEELNFSSDVDLIFAYPEEGETKGAVALSNHEFFLRLGQSLINTLNENTADGFVFRVDMRLRPNGASGPLALSFAAMEHYYQTHGREWERYAFIKARVIAGDRKAGEELLQTLKPFVYRKYLDYGTIESIRDMKGMIEREMARKGMQGNIKLGRGGIREIEFIVQTQQLIRGGREPQLQERRLLKVLPHMVAAGCIAPPAADELTQAYVFLRNIEHRLQMMADQQTQQLPTDEITQQRLAFAAGFDDVPALMDELERQRGKVHGHFAQLFHTGEEAAGKREPDPLAAVWLGAAEAENAKQILRDSGYARSDEALNLVNALREGPMYKAFSTGARARMDRVLPLVLEAAGKSDDPLTTLQRLVHLLEAIGRRTVYFSLMAENPRVLTQLVRLGGASPWIANWIAQHPILLDELLDPVLHELPTPETLQDELRQRLAHIPEEDLELQMEVLREFRHGHVLRVAAADLARDITVARDGRQAPRGTSSSISPAPPSERASPRDGGATDVGSGLAPEQTGAALAMVAECVVAAALELANRDLERKHGAPRCPDGETSPGFAVIGYGKLGSRELGYGSDLDMIYLYEGCTEGATRGPRSLPNEAYFARLGQRLIHILTTRTPGGILYEVDMRLRPSGKSGPLVSSLDAFLEYQRDHAWTWEHQALVRARPVAGNPRLRQGFAEIRKEILCQPRDPNKLKMDVREMREKMAAEKVNHGATQADIKHDPGGIVDIEFMVQYWVLRWAHDHPGLTRHTENIQILEALEAEGLLEPARARWLSEAYRRYLSVEHRLKLMERGSLADPAELGEWPERVRRLWDETFND
ncbi:MAG: bifunctional [glutamate--ammonia ligase]-adenylyl-L-tyrosine phosphorylase/[glutamate--ammonia-ligase] adenylyltransferase [Gammaproteobacteria bacterium]|nr:bifunctional [glutamate--ammonia ligase]-adenylyl-L-tyrosine phosphorylase/[glutamate--ammonia-ligase] adenylyltransferase [Gammaproteobacteria bacterium]MDH3370316.1 bifunctional [glutamate--ammonia ligase]-adenylyl-L-tyrosine phosphorylase/[glutamate--ammonia-ligase] adenylyltransferase [Gammaproteobacteria bacterium]MDH3406212.1 bifunctional [glutamate--ammonia ligase]-adenylyl-L-tyrosine phosphorylase/[glutamate--ammonia-ligase] adenylyltransferase [Gammaproteobacteria bacterium]MDH548650